MKKILHIAYREFSATVMTKGFIIGMLIMPVMIGIIVLVFPRMMNQAPPKVAGEIAVIDPTGQVTEGLRAYLRPERFVERREAASREVAEATPEAVKKVVASSPGGQEAIQRQVAAAFGEVPRLDVVALDPGTDLELAKAPLKAAGSSDRTKEPRRLALIVLHPDAVRRAAGKVRFGSYELFVRSKLDDRIEDDIRNGLRDAIVEARIQASGLKRSEIEALTRVDRPQSRTVTEAGERATNEVLNTLMPAAFMILLLISSLTSGQSLLTTTVEEKASRVVEVLLSAVSPMELMTGKILGQMAVGFVVLALYGGLGIVALFSFAMLGLLDPMLILFLLVFFVLAYFTLAAFMAAIGSAVNEMREAQTLMTPVMLIIMIPWILWLPISREPNSPLAVVLSFIPPLGNFVVLLRMTSTAPPPMWQVGLAMVVSGAGAAAAVWAAAKIFRIGLLMFGKPPTFGTLIRWIRMS
jgi:ABC-2 type transport system permease protein